MSGVMGVRTIKKAGFFILFALIPALCLCACAAPGQTREVYPPAASSGAQLMLTDPSPAPELSSGFFQPESPAIGDEGVFPGAPAAVAAQNGDGDAADLDLSFDGEQSQAAGSFLRGNARPEEVRSVWISYLEMQNLLKGKTESQFRRNMAEVFGNVRDFELNTVILQVRPFADALYPSRYFPWSYIVTGAEGQDPGFDPLAVMISEARSRELRVEVWINPYRIRAAGNNNGLCETNQAKAWLDAGSESVIRYNGALSFNPASDEARSLIVNGARELVRNYDIDALHIDDYFYPSTDAAFDAASYSRYQKGGGALSLADWRRRNVEALLKDMYAAVKEEDKNVLFGISPQGSVDNNYNAQYLDVRKIVSESGYCDYICPQIYFGFENAAQPFLQTLEAWNRMIGVSPVRLHVGLAAYKIGAQDSWAGAGSLEWTQNTDLLKKMVEAARAQSCYGGFAIYRYESLFSPADGVSASVRREAENLRAILD